MLDTTHQILLVLLVLTSHTLAEDDDITKFMKDIEIIPDVLEEAPTEFLKIEFADGKMADKGQELTPKETKDAPKLDWSTETGAYYTVIMSNVDPPSRSNPKWREWLHWLVVNIPEKDVEKGEIITPYLGPAPPKTSGLLRYVFLVFKQANKMTFDETPLNNTSVAGHSNFSSMKFSKKYSMGTPVAGNALQAKWDEFVPTIHKMLNIII